ncbi:hypothetical protein ALC57_08549 [Trachymyrmex cornetzi]|uniref:CCHC-type domain-containing protein n=1 Tax=Trachymyrmex cornetzi TaxID=471704 RepID=A0A151J721_9HYME|nr:hypothetical protein ALC57_08549 [Trachymyrmex cornetzi]
MASTDRDANNTQPLTSAITSNRYGKTDHAPFIVHIHAKIEHITESSYEVMMKRQVSRIISSGLCSIKKIGRGKIAVEMRNFYFANALASNKDLDKHGLFAFIPLHRTVRSGIIRGIPTSITDQDLRSDLRSTSKIIEIKRLNKRITINGKTDFVPSTTVNLKFAGQSLSKHVTLYYDLHAVSPFIFRIKTCFNCYRIGHISKYCKRNPRCRLCGQPPHGEETICERQDLSPKYINCNGDHLSTSSNCPLFIRQKNIQSLAAVENISLNEARKRVLHNSNATGSYDFPTFNAARPAEYRNFPMLPHIVNSNPPSINPNRFSIFNSYNDSYLPYSETLKNSDSNVHYGNKNTQAHLSRQHGIKENRN